jgi:hypothetical protein
MKIRIHIDRLVLDGLPATAAQAPLVQEALQRELASCLAAGGLSPELRGGGAFPVVRAAGPKLPQQKQQNPSELGSEIARSIHGAIGGSK